MQCPDCGYISFKQAKGCGSCGFDFKKAAASTASLFRNDSFTIFSAPEKEQDVPQAGEDVAVIEAPESSQESSELESGEFLLNLPDTEQDSSETTLKSDDSVPSSHEFVPMEFGSDDDISLEEIEVEGLGLGLEPFEDATPTKPEPEEISIETSEEVSDRASDDITLEIDGLDDISAKPEPAETPIETNEEVSDRASDDITLEIDGLDDISEGNDLDKDDDVLEIVPSPAQDLAEPVAPVLDLGDTEISLDFDEDFEPASPEPAPAQIDELEIKLEIDDSEGPLTISKDKTPEVEIEDLGLELEDSPDPEKP